MSQNRFPKKPQTSYGRPTPPDRYWLWGKHACLAAINNHQRNYYQILITKNALRDLVELQDHKKVEEVDGKTISKLLPADAVHQGIAVEVAALPSLDIESLPIGKNIVVMDQVTDPHNIGAVLRSAAAFGIGALLTTARHAPHETATLAKSASGALEIVPMVKVGNLSTTLESLKKQGYICVGLAGEATETLDALSNKKGHPIAFVMGAEGKGLRQKTRETCDMLVKIPMEPAMESLNVSNAAAICFYALKSLN